MRDGHERHSIGATRLSEPRNSKPLRRSPVAWDIANETDPWRNRSLWTNRPSIEIPDEAVPEITPDLSYRRLAMVNIVLYGQPNSPGWVLIDAGLPGTAGMVAHSAEARFGKHGPAMQFTADWPKAGASFATLAALEPEVVVTGHGRVMQGPTMRAALPQLAEQFDRVAVPHDGRYV